MFQLIFVPIFVARVALKHDGISKLTSQVSAQISASTVLSVCFVFSAGNLDLLGGMASFVYHNSESTSQ